MYILGTDYYEALSAPNQRKLIYGEVYVYQYFNVNDALSCTSGAVVNLYFVFLGV